MDQVHFHEMQKKEALDLMRSNFCRVEWKENGLEGIFCVPGKKNNEEPIRFSFFLGEQLHIWESCGKVFSFWEKRKKREEETAERCLVQLLELFSEDDVFFLQHMEQQLGKMEDALMKEEQIPFPELFLKYRSKLCSFHYFYEQMIDLAEDLQMEYGRRGREDIQAEWLQYGGRMERLHEYITYLREYIIQLRDLYHTLLDDRQNKGINYLTVVTSLFLPLTLLTGWYGMNFNSMPEVSWKYGYLWVIAVAVLLIVGEIIFIKKKQII